MFGIRQIIGSIINHTRRASNDIGDKTVASTFDANDRLLSEAMNVADPDDDRFTVYGYGTGNAGTQQTLKTVHEGLDDAGNVVERTDYEYNLES